MIYWLRSKLWGGRGRFSFLFYKAPSCLLWTSQKMERTLRKCPSRTQFHFCLSLCLAKSSILCDDFSPHPIFAFTVLSSYYNFLFPERSNRILKYRISEGSQGGGFHTSGLEKKGSLNSLSQRHECLLLILQFVFMPCLISHNSSMQLILHTLEKMKNCGFFHTTTYTATARIEELGEGEKTRGLT